MLKLTKGTKIVNTNNGNVFTVEDVKKDGYGSAKVVFADGSRSIYSAERLKAFFQAGTLAILTPEDIELGVTGEDWEPTKVNAFYAQKGDLFAFGATQTEALANLKEMLSKVTVQDSEAVSMPTLAIGDKVAIHGFIGEVVERREYPSRGSIVVQVDLSLVAYQDEEGRLNFNRLKNITHNGMKRAKYATLQGNELYKVARVTLG